MKCRISSCNKTILKKDLTRFAPAWALYTVVLLIYLTLQPDTPYPIARSLTEMMCASAVINMGYALICAQLLFGDLFNSRLCNALHALPMRRESWFAIHTLSGILYALVPNLVAATIGSFLLPSAPQLFWLWLAVSMGQYLFFFGLAIFCCYCVGSRFAMVVVYGLINFLSLILFWFLDTLYTPLLYGLQTQAEPFLDWCPVVRLSGYSYVEITRAHATGGGYSDAIASITLGDGWGYLGLCAGAGIVFAALGCLLYRRRNLESAGDFIAIQPLKPLFLVIYTLTMGAMVHMLSTLFGTSELRYGFLFVGLTIGFFTGLMLLDRRTRVFGKRNLLGYGLLTAVVVLSLVLTALDPMGITARIPRTDQIQSVTLGPIYGTRNSGAMTDEQAIADVQTIHRDALAAHKGDIQGDLQISFSLHYTLKDGRTISRYYTIPQDCEGARLLEKYFSSPVYLFGETIADPDAFLAGIQSMYVDGEWDTVYLDSPQEREALFQAILADCRDGNMAQDYWFHHTDMPNTHSLWVCMETLNEDNIWDYYNLTIYDDCTHTRQCLETMGIFPPAPSDSE